LLEQHISRLEHHASSSNTLKDYVDNREFYYWHLAQLPELENKQFDRHKVCAAWQIEHSDSIDALYEHLNEQELLSILKHRSLFLRLQKFLPETSGNAHHGSALA
jgi:membrane glycosyltransferase